MDFKYAGFYVLAAVIYDDTPIPEEKMNRYIPSRIVAINVENEENAEFFIYDSKTDQYSSIKVNLIRFKDVYDYSYDVQQEGCTMKAGDLFYYDGVLCYQPYQNAHFISQFVKVEYKGESNETEG